jgi:glutathione synthase/RimK-type ligase-like ATP-grasp enzyme
VKTKEVCIRAVSSVNLEMAGVDIVFDRDQKPYLLEINFPTGFRSFKMHPILLNPKWLIFLLKNRKEQGYKT